MSMAMAIDLIKTLVHMKHLSTYQLALVKTEITDNSAPASKMSNTNLTQEELKAKYQKILRDNGLAQYVERVEITVPKLQGEHMASFCLYVSLHLGNGTTKELFVKELPTNQAHLGMLLKYKLFWKEEQAFNVMIKNIQEYYMKKTGSNKLLDFFPKCFYADEKEIILENLVKGKGYHLNSKHVKLGYEAAVMTMKNLAQFHAVGYCLIEEAGGRPEFYEKYPFLLETAFYGDDPMLISMFDNSLNVSVGLLNSHKIPGSEALPQRLTNKLGQSVNDVCNYYKHDSPNLFNVVTHGDCWNNNLLLLQDPNTKELIHQVLIDFQLMRIGSPNNDISYFMFTSLKMATRQKYWQTLLKIYYDNFIARLKELNKTLPFTFDEFRKDFLQKVPLGFWMNNMFTIGMEIMDSMDMTKCTGDVAAYLRDSIAKWLADNPEYAKEQAELIVEAWKEFDEFTAML